MILQKIYLFWATGGTFSGPRMTTRPAMVKSETGRFDTNSSSEIAEKFRSLQVKFAVEQEKHFG